MFWLKYSYLWKNKRCITFFDRLNFVDLSRKWMLQFNSRNPRRFLLFENLLLRIDQLYWHPRERNIYRICENDLNFTPISGCQNNWSILNSPGTELWAQPARDNFPLKGHFGYWFNDSQRKFLRIFKKY